MRKRTPMPPKKALRLTKLLFYGGLGLAVIVYFACQSTLWQEREFPPSWWRWQSWGSSACWRGWAWPSESSAAPTAERP